MSGFQLKKLVTWDIKRIAGCFAGKAFSARVSLCTAALSGGKQHMSEGDRYRESGVDIEKGNRFVERIKSMVQSTHNSSVLTDIGGFSGMVSLNTSHYAQPVLVSSTDGV
ncbi:MAG: hypothetical protein ABIK12_05020, partial [Pseudomonadota bacterium]